MKKLKDIAINKEKTNHYKILQKYLKKQYPHTDKKNLNALCREIIFAPSEYKTTIENTPIKITAVRNSIANFIERDNSNRSFIPYSLDAEIADLIEQNNCETSSMNEYYRWVSATAEILKQSTTEMPTDDFFTSRTSFIAMSFEREAEILLCLALYQGSDNEHNIEKMNILRFKLARLREMRSIVNNTLNAFNNKTPDTIQKLRQSYEYCLTLLAEKINFDKNFNLKLKLNHNHNSEEDLEEDYSYLNYLQMVVLYMMRESEDLSTGRQNSANSKENIERSKANYRLSSDNEPRSR